MRKLICTLLAAAFVTASIGATAFAAETENTTAAEMTDAQEETAALISGEYAVDISWTPMSGMISPILDIDAENMTFNLYNASAPETSKGSGTIAYADGVYTMTYSDGNTTAFTYADGVITFTSKLFYGTASFDQTDDNGSFISYTASMDAADTTETTEATETTESTGSIESGSGSLVCYMPAMGGCNLSENLVENISYIDNADGSVTITLDFYEVGEWSSMYFDGQTTYVADAGQIAYYDGSAWVDAEYTTAPSSDGSYTYVDTMTFTAAEKTKTYDLALYMSDYQFGGDTPSAVSSGEQMTATLTMNWASDTEETTEPTEDTTESTEAATTTAMTTTAASTTTAATNTAATTTAAGTKRISISSLDNLEAGTYQLTASLSCWMSAMGGCDFGKDLLKSAVLTVGTDGSKKVTIYLHEMVDVMMAYGTASAYAEDSGEIGYRNGSGWAKAEYTTASGTSEEGAYTYVNSMTFPISAVSNTYDLAMCIGGTQFGGESARMLSDGSVLAATLSVDWTKAYTNVKVSSNGTVTNTGSTSASPKTGDTLPMAAGIVLLLSAGAAVCLYKKRNEE